MAKKTNRLLRFFCYLSAANPPWLQPNNMRLIGHLENESSAKTLGDYLVSLNIRNLVEPDAGGWAVWIYSEDQIEAGRQALSHYLENPNDSKFQRARETAAAVSRREEREKAEYNRRIHTPDRIWVSSNSIGPITLTLMGISVGVTLLSFLRPESAIVNALFMSDYAGRSLPEVHHGQIWRLFTPIFIHFDFLHILFNMLMLRDLGSLVENRRGPRVYLWLVAVLALGSNLGQYYYSGPEFGGMSGVLYGLLGYIWLRGQVDPDSGLFVSPMTLGIMLVWFFLCLVGIIPGVANACHAAGLVLGMIIGALPALRRMF